MKTLTDEAACVFANFVRCVTGILRVVGVDEGIHLLRRCADDLENNRAKLEAARTRGQRERARA